MCCHFDPGQAPRIIRLQFVREESSASPKSLSREAPYTGLGTGIFGSPNNNTLMGSAPRHRQGIAGGILACARNTGMALGVGLAAAVFTTVLAYPPADATVPPIFHAIGTALLMAAGMALLGVVTSAVR